MSAVTRRQFGITAVTFMGGTTLALGLPWPSEAAPTVTLSTRSMVTNLMLVNSQRKGYGLPALKISDPLWRAARYYAKYLADNDADGHTADNRTPQQRIKAAGFSGCTTGENVYTHWNTQPQTESQIAFRAMSAWMRSPGHRANILNRKYTHIGIAFASTKRGDRYIYKAVQTFGGLC